MKKMLYFLLTLSLLFLFSTISLIAQVGLPEWPIVRGPIGNDTSLDANAVMVDLTSQIPHSYSILPALSDKPGCSQAGFDTCKTVFYVLHTGPGNENYGLSVFRRSDNFQLLGPGSQPYVQGLNGKKSDNEIQVILHPDRVNHPLEWFIIYAENDNNPASGFNNGQYQPTNILYSRIKLDASGNLLSIPEIDVPLDVNGTNYTYVNGKAASRPNTSISPQPGGGYFLYACRRAKNGNTITIDRFIIDANGITYESNSLPVSSAWWDGTVTGSSVELSPNEARLAVTTREQANDQAYLFIFDCIPNITQASNSPIDLAQLVIDCPGHLADNQTIYSAGINGLWGVQFLRNFERKISGIEFSPSGQYLYVTNGGYATGGRNNLTYLGQIDLNQDTATIRLQIQTTLNYNPTDGLGLSWDSVTEYNYLIWHAITAIQSGYDGNFYFTKLNCDTLFVLPYPDSPMPSSLTPYPVNLADPFNNKLNIPMPGAYTLLLPEQIDGYDYLLSEELCLGDPCDSINAKLSKLENAPCCYLFEISNVFNPEAFTSISITSENLSISSLTIDPVNCPWGYISSQTSTEVILSLNSGFNGIPENAPGSYQIIGTLCFAGSGDDLVTINFFGSSPEGEIFCIQTLKVGPCNAPCPCCSFDELLIPNGITPNGDGKNDVLNIVNSEDCDINLTVFNRWGNIVYKDGIYHNDWVGENKNGDKLPQGTYYVLLELPNGSKKGTYIDIRY